jgi:hypothetical protein
LSEEPLAFVFKTQVATLQFKKINSCFFSLIAGGTLFGCQGGNALANGKFLRDIGNALAISQMTSSSSALGSIDQ